MLKNCDNCGAEKIHLISGSGQKSVCSGCQKELIRATIILGNDVIDLRKEAIAEDYDDFSYGDGDEEEEGDEDYNAEEELATARYIK
jgi:hypothetical protein